MRSLSTVKTRTARPRGRLVVAALLSAAAAMVTAAPSLATAGPTWTFKDVTNCGNAAAGHAGCLSIRRDFFRDGVAYHPTSPADLARVAGLARAGANPATSGGFTAAGMRTAYGITGSGDASRVIAIVDAYGAPTAYTNLTAYRSAMALPSMAACDLATQASRTSGDAPCFAQVGQSGGPPPTTTDAGWAGETDLDVQAASAMCPGCSILLVESTDNSDTNLAVAVGFAAGAAHVQAISNSYGGGDVPSASYPQYDGAALNGIAVTASTGDNRYQGGSFPADSTQVIAVGGTSLTVDGTGARASETVWDSLGYGTGSGCSTLNPAPGWEVILGNPCNGYKATADISADADPNTGLQVYTGGGWGLYGGTSLSSPLTAAQYVLQGGYGPSHQAGAYTYAASTPHFDVTSGSNGSCSPTVLCTAGTGWDGPTGLGSIVFNPAQATASAYTLTGPAGGTLGTPATFTVTPNGPFTGTISVAVSGAGLASTSALTFTGTSTGQTFTITPTAGGRVTLTPTNGGGLTDPAGITYTVASLTVVSPASGKTGTALTITGSGLTGTSAVTIGGVGVTPFWVLDDNHIIVGQPSLTLGAATVTLTTTYGSVSASFTVLRGKVAPVITAATPAAGAVTVTGGNVGAATAVSLHSKRVKSIPVGSFTVTAANKLAFTVPTGLAHGTYTVTVTSAGGTSKPYTLTL